jgi:hypothetical protein
MPSNGCSWSSEDVQSASTAHRPSSANTGPTGSFRRPMGSLGMLTGPASLKGAFYSASFKEKGIPDYSTNFVTDYYYIRFSNVISINNITSN